MDRKADKNLQKTASKNNAKDPRTEERLNAFIGNIHDGVYETDVHGNFTYFNKALCKILGHPAKAVQGQNFSHFMDKENARKAYDAFTKVWVTHKGFSEIIWQVIDKTGNPRILELSANLIRGKKGKKTGFRGIARDVTERFRDQEALKASELRYQRAYERSRRSERWTQKLLDFVPYPMVVYTHDGKVTYINPAFTNTFGWRLEEVNGKQIPYIPPELKEKTSRGFKKLLQGKDINEPETRRLTKDGRILDVHMRGTVFLVDEGASSGELITLRDVTEEKRLARNTEALLRISTALPAYPDLEKLLDYISDEVKGLLNVDAVQVMLLDEEKKEFFFKGAAYDRTTAQKEVKEIRFPADKGLAGKVVKTGEAIVVHDTAKAPGFHPIRDEKLGFHTRNLIDVPLKSADRIIGVLSALNKKEGKFGQRDVELLNTISGTVALSIENARFSDELKAAYKEMKSLNRAKDRVISHLSHELKTPIAVLSSSLHTLEKRLRQVTEESWQPTMERSRRNLNRLVEIQHQAEDIMRDKEYKNYNLLTHLLERCSDELEALVAEQAGEGPLVDRIRERIEDIFRPKESQAFEIQLDHFVRERLEALNDQFLQRKIELISRLEPAPRFCIPRDVTRKIADGLIRNAIENTPDGGRIEVVVHKKSAGTELMVRDYGVGITAENQARIFEGFFPTQDAIEYATRRPFDFNAGGKGADLLRMKIFAERYNFTIEMNTSRCRFIPLDTDRCPGKIIACGFCREKGDCLQSGGSSFCVFFPSKLQKKGLQT